MHKRASRNMADVTLPFMGSLQGMLLRHPLTLSVQKVLEQEERQGREQASESSGFPSADRAAEPLCIYQGHSYKGMVEHSFFLFFSPLQFAKTFLLGNNFRNKNSAGAPGWLSQVKRPTLAQVRISRFVGLSPASSQIGRAHV